MKNRPVLFVVLGCLAMAAASVRAEPGDGSGWRRFGDHFDRDDRRRAERVERIHELREERRREFMRMSPEERLQLRRDIRAAREGVYRRPPPPMLPPPPQEPPR